MSEKPPPFFLSAGLKAVFCKLSILFIKAIVYPYASNMDMAL